MSADVIRDEPSKQFKLSRRAMLGAGAAGMLAVPALSGISSWRMRQGENRVLLHDPGLEAGRSFADAGKAHGLASRAIEGDRIRLAREIFGAGPAMAVGISRHADLLLIGDVAREAGYRIVAEMDGRAGLCTTDRCAAGWASLGRIMQASGRDWPQNFAAWAASAEQPQGTLPNSQSGPSDKGLAIAWVFAKPA